MHIGTEAVHGSGARSFQKLALWNQGTGKERSANYASHPLRWARFSFISMFPKLFLQRFSRNIFLAFLYLVR